MSRCRSSNRLIASIIAQERPLLIYLRLDEGDEASKRDLITSRVLKFDPQTPLIWRAKDISITKPTTGAGEWFRQKNAHEEKGWWIPGLNQQIQSKRGELCLFVGRSQHDRFLGQLEYEAADDADLWHWLNLEKCLLKQQQYLVESPAPKEIHGNSRICRELNSQKRSEWLAARKAWFVKTIHPKLLSSLGFFAERYGDTPSFTVSGGRRSLAEYVRRQGVVLRHWNRKNDSQKVLESSILGGEWPSVAARLKTHFRSPGAYDEKASTRAVERAVKMGRVSTAAAREWFQKHNAVSKVAAWAGKQQTQKAIA